MSPCGPAGRLKARRDLEGTALGISLESEGELQQSRHDVVMRFIGSHRFAVDNSYDSRFWSRRFALFPCELFHFSEDLIRRQHPVHRNGVALFRWTIEPQRTVAAGSASDLDLPPRNEIAANQTVTFLIERMPGPKLIEASQRFEFILVRQSDCSS